MTGRSWAGASLACVAALVLGVWAAWPAEAPSRRRAAGASARTAAVPTAPDEDECIHPYVPTAVGTVLEYRCAGSAGEARATMALLHARRAGTGSILTWAVENGGTSELERACDEDGAEEPWMALGAGGGVALSGQTWRVPREPRAGTRYAGSIETSILGLTISLERTHTVVGPEAVTIGGTTYDALRVSVEDRTVGANAPIPSVEWLAAGVGLVRLEIGPDADRSSCELTESSIPD